MSTHLAFSLPLPLAERALALLPESRVAQHVRFAAQSASPDELSRLALLARQRRGAVLRAWLGVLATGPVDPRPAWLLGIEARADEDRLLLALARARLGDNSARDELAGWAGRRLPTVGGDRAPALAISRRPLVERFDSVRAGGDDILARARRRDPRDLDALHAARETAGRRGDHALLVALADHGDPRAYVDFKDALLARDVDPGRGFTQRRLAADGLGALGLRAGVSLIAGALRDERADFEGRPGAGLGIQYPVRANLLYALGEIGHTSAIPLLLPYLDDSSSSALGGLDLPAMDSLLRIGPTAAEPLRRALSGLGERGRRNATALLGALASAPR